MSEFEFKPHPSTLASNASKEALFGVPEEKISSNRVTKIAAGVVSAGVMYGAYKAGVGLDSVDNLLDWQVVPQPDVVPAIVDGFVLMNDGLRTIAPAVTVAALSYRWNQKRQAKLDPNKAKLEKLADTDYSGADEYTSENGDKTRLSKIRKVFAGVGLAAVTLMLTGGSSGVENEISNGPLRPIQRTFDTLMPNSDEGRLVITQAENNTFMDDSYLDANDVNRLADSASKKGVNIIPFSKRLPNIDGRSGILIGIPDSAFEEFSGSRVSSTCEQLPVVVDSANKSAVGNTVSLNNTEALIVKKTSNSAQMNRDVAIVADSSLDCIDGGSSTYFGALVTGVSKDQLEARIAKSPLSNNAAVVEEREFLDNNRKFWQKNGTPILLQLIAYLGAFGALATGSERRGKLQQNINEIGILNASGLSMKEIGNIEKRRAYKLANKALIGAAGMPAMAAIFNSAEVGLKVGVGLRELCVGYTITLAATFSGSQRAVTRFGKKLNLARAVKD